MKVLDEPAHRRILAPLKGGLLLGVFEVAPRSEAMRTIIHIISITHNQDTAREGWHTRLDSSRIGTRYQGLGWCCWRTPSAPA